MTTTTIICDYKYICDQMMPYACKPYNCARKAFYEKNKIPVEPVWKK